MADTVLEAQGLGRRIGGRWIWRRLTLELSPGDRGMLVGPSGSGKSLLLRCLCGLDSPDEGEVRYRGEILDGKTLPDFRSRVVYVQQSPVLVPGSVTDNLRLPSRFRVHAERADLVDRALAVLRDLGTAEDLPDQRSSRLSGGEGQLVGLARALALDPEVLLLDEPTAHLDPDTTRRVERLVARWTDEGERAVLWTSHDPAQVDRVRAGPLIELTAEER